VLGLSSGGQPVVVKQAVKHDGSIVHVFNVCVDLQNDVVLLKVDERLHQSQAFVASSKGALRKAVTYAASEPPIERSLQEAQKDFASERAVWTAASN
jgi:hypothetical protein